MAGRRLVLIGALAAAFAAALPAAAAKLPAAPGDMALGSPKAPVQVVEYASLSCSHCANFHRDVFPAFKAKYVDTGKVRFVFREVLTPPGQVAAAGYMMARCAGPSKYFKVLGEVFASQPRWGNDVRSVFLGIAADNGMDEARFTACLGDPANLAAVNARAEAARAAGVQATPTFFVNGRKHEGVMSLQQLDAAIAAAAR